MNYSELQKLAKDLNVPSFGLKKVELELAVKEAQTKRGSNIQKDEPVAQESNVVEEVKPQVPKKVNTAVIYNGKMEIRRYSLDVHGDKFSDMALQFVEDRKGCRVEFLDVQAMHICSACGHKDYER